MPTGARIDTPRQPLYTRADVSLRTVAVSERRFSMSAQQTGGWTQRRFLGGLTVAGMVGDFSLTPRWVVAQRPPETTTLKFLQTPGICFAPQFVADALLQAEGFTEVHFVPAAGQVHFST
jgi:hypothetical protein